MLPKDLSAELTNLNLLPNASVTSSGNGTGVDTKAIDGAMIAVANVGTATAGTTPTLDLKIQDSADNSSWADCINPDTGSVYAFTQVTNANSLQVMKLDRRAVRRYVRIVKTIGGTSSPAFPAAASIHGQTKQI